MTTDTLPSGGGRRMEARRRKAKQRRQRTIAGVVAGVLLAVVALVVLVKGGGNGKAGDGTAAPTRTQQTVLLQIKNAAGLTMSNALLAQDPATGQAAALLVPPTVLATPPGSAAIPFNQIFEQSKAASARDALSDLVGVTIDASWVIDASAFAKLVDALGGVTVDVDVQVLGGASGRQVLLSPGSQTLTGAQAVAFAFYLASGEPDQSRLVRLQSVLEGLLAKLPDGAPQLRSRIDALGFNSNVTGFDVAKLSAFLLAMQADNQSDKLQFDTLPVSTVETGAATPSLAIDLAASQQVVDRLLAASVPEGARAGNNRVRVYNGVGTPGLGNAVRAKLVKAGLVFVGSSNNSRFGIATTLVLINDSSPDAQALGQRVARALGVPATAVMVSGRPTSIADVIVVVGADFKAG